MNSKGMLGKTIALWVATIVIVILLLLFIIGSGIVRKIDESGAGLKVYSPSEIGLENLREYMKDYYSIIDKRYLTNQEKFGGDYEE
jgi:hypothetical protein